MCACIGSGRIRKRSKAIRVLADDRWPEALAHRAYVDSLPDAKNMTTPLFFTTEERALLEGTNLAGAVVDTETNWRAELESLQSLLKEDGLTW